MIKLKLIASLFISVFATSFYIQAYDVEGYNLEHFECKLCNPVTKNGSLKHDLDAHLNNIDLLADLAKNNKLPELYQYLIELDLITTNIQIEDQISRNQLYYKNQEKLKKRTIEIIYFDIAYWFSQYREEFKFTSDLKPYLQLYPYCKKFTELKRSLNVTSNYNLSMITKIILDKAVSFYRKGDQDAISFFNKNPDLKM